CARCPYDYDGFAYW
nr:immunoglobulin heavy chain junction region [Mus musculus]NSM05164.1 immunoglobulin heavy chain junction region [Mus musculus]